MRNWINFDNPFWPDLKVNDSPRSGSTGRARIDWQRSEPNNYHSGINMNLPLGQSIEYLLARPFSIKHWQFERIVDYGAGVAWGCYRWAWLHSCSQSRPESRITGVQRELEPPARTRA